MLSEMFKIGFFPFFVYGILYIPYVVPLCLMFCCISARLLMAINDFKIEITRFLLSHFDMIKDL